MSEADVKSYGDMILPPSIATRADISRIASELERIDNEMTANMVREKIGSNEQTVPALSGQLSEFLNGNELSLDNSHRRTEIIKQVRLLKDKAPVVHMTFAVTADRESLVNLVDWLRKEVNPQTLIAVGLQPSLVAGVYIRTPNHVHDFSLRSMIREKHGALVSQIGELRGAR